MQLPRISVKGRPRRWFSNWVPGKVYTPNPVPKVNLQDEYISRLDLAVKENLNELAASLKVEQTVPSVIRHLLGRHSLELKTVRKGRSSFQKMPWSPSGSYSQFLRALYSSNGNANHIRSALRKLPGASHSLQAQYIDGEHLEALIDRSLTFPSLYVSVFKMLQEANLPTTSREKAQYVLHLYNTGGSWQESLRMIWPDLVASRDIGSFNILLKLAYMSRRRDLQDLVACHINPPDRFTYLLKMRYGRGPNIRDLLREFRDRGLVLDIATLGAVMASSLRSSNSNDRAAAEMTFEKYFATNAFAHVQDANANRLANILKALDNVNAIVAKSYDVPIVLDSKFYTTFYGYYIYQGKHDAAVETLEKMTRQNYILPRHKIQLHITRSRLETSTLERLFYLCCDVNLAHPGFISDGFAQAWALQMASTGIPYETASSIITRNRGMQI